MPQPQILIKPNNPKINWGNSLTKGLVFDAPLWEGAGTVTEEDASPAGLEVVGTIIASGATWNKNFFGTDLDFSAAASSVSFANTPASMNALVGTPFSFEALVLERNTGGGGVGRIFHKTAANPNGSWQVFTGNTAANQFNFQVTYTANGIWTWSNALPTGVWVHVVVTYDGRSLSNVPTGFINGVKTAPDISVQPTGSPTITEDTFAYIGNRQNALRNWNGKIAYVRVWNRLLADTEAQSLYQNPWQIYLKPNLNLSYWLVAPAQAAVIASVVNPTLLFMGVG